MSDDLVKRARHNALADMPHYASVELIEAMAARIEELEAKLEKAEVIVHIVASDKWDERLGEAVDLSCEYLAELKGQDDE